MAISKAGAKQIARFKKAAKKCKGIKGGEDG
jgi:hypothetical protein